MARDNGDQPDLIVVIGWVLLSLIFHRSKVEPLLLGKAAIASQLLLLAYVLLSVTFTGLPPVHDAFIILTAGLTAVSGLQYIYKDLNLQMPPKSGIEIEAVQKDSLAEQAGLQPGDLLASINGHKLHDAIDLMFHRDLDNVDLEFYRSGQKHKITLPEPEETDLGITVKPFKVKTCKNNCVFCFVKQLPKGLRKTLYLKDEDYRLSFLYGNYITLSNLDCRDRKRIIEQRLSPLYISVHTTNKALRARMLGALKACDIMKELEYFASNR